jgi:hypothetical protein
MSTIDSQQQNEKSLRRYVFNASREPECSQEAEISVIASSEEEALDQAQARIAACDVDWDELEVWDEGYADLTLDSQEDLTDEEIEEYRRQKLSELEAIRDAEQQLTRRSKLRTLLESLRATASEEERASLLNSLEETLL